MKQEIEDTTVFTEEMIEDWCKFNDDPNPLHVDAGVAGDGVFGQRIVPGMMVLGKISGLLTLMGEGDEQVILGSIVACRFRDPMLLDEPIEIRLEVKEETNQFTAVDIEVRAPERGSLTMTGVINVVVE